MNEALGTGVQLTVIFGFLGTIFSFAVLRPLNNAIIKLETMIEEIRLEIRRSEGERHRLEIKIAEIEAKIK